MLGDLSYNVNPFLRYYGGARPQQHMRLSRREVVAPNSSRSSRDTAEPPIEMSPGSNFNAPLVPLQPLHEWTRISRTSEALPRRRERPLLDLTAFACSSLFLAKLFYNSWMKGDP